MNFGDWELFKILVSSLRKEEDLGPADNIAASKEVNKINFAFLTSKKL